MVKNHNIRVFSFQPFYAEHELWLSLLLNNISSPIDSDESNRFLCAKDCFGEVRISGRVTHLTDLPRPPHFPLNLKTGPQDRLPDAVEVLLTSPEEALLKVDFTNLAKNSPDLLEWDKITIVNSSASIVFHQHGIPQLVRSFDLLWKDDKKHKLSISNVFEGKPQSLADKLLAPLLQDGIWAKTACDVGFNCFLTLIRRMSEQNTSIKLTNLNCEECFPPYTDHIVLLSEPKQIWLESLHARYENYTGESISRPHLKHGEEGFHFGWGFSTIQGICSEDAAQGLRILLFVQSSWYQLRFFRKYLLANMTNPFSSKNNLNNIQLVNESFSRLLLAYERFLAEHGSFRANQNPKFYALFKQIESRWHMDEDIVAFRDSIQLTGGLIDRALTKSTEERQKKRDITLQLILTAGQAILILLGWNTLESLSIASLTPPDSYLRSDYVRLGIGIIVSIIFFAYFYLASRTRTRPGK